MYCQSQRAEYGSLPPSSCAPAPAGGLHQPLTCPRRLALTAAHLYRFHVGAPSARCARRAIVSAHRCAAPAIRLLCPWRSSGCISRLKGGGRSRWQRPRPRRITHVGGGSRVGDARHSGPVRCRRSILQAVVQAATLAATVQWPRTCGRLALSGQSYARWFR